MTREDKELLLKDLCARLPYNPLISINGERYRMEEIRNALIGINAYKITVDGCDIEYMNIKPYLFPLSSMTEEQKKEYNYWKHEVPVCRYEYGDVVEEIELNDSPESFEYLIENHFDYRGLIEKGLAIDATGLNIY